MALGGFHERALQVAFGPAGAELAKLLADRYKHGDAFSSGCDANTLGFFGVTAVARATAFTQTYSTADKTFNLTVGAALTDSSGGTANTTLQDVEATYTEATLANNFADLAARCNELRTDLIDLAQCVNSIVDDLQAYGILQ